MRSEDGSSPAMGYQEILRRLAIIDEGFVGDHAGRVLGVPGAWVLDAKTAALVRVGALAAIGSAPACLQWSTTRALAAGATVDEITGVLLAIAPGDRARPGRLRRPTCGDRARVRHRDRARGTRRSLTPRS